MLLFVYAVPMLWPRARRRCGRWPAPLPRTAARDDGRDDPARVRRVDADEDGWHHRLRLGVPLAVDADSGGAAAGSSSRRAGSGAAVARSGASSRVPAKPPMPASRPSAAAPRPRDRRSGWRAAKRAEWPGFRGPARDGIVRGVRIETDWSHRRPSSCGAGRSDRAGRPSRSTATLSTRRSSAATTRSSSCYELTTGEPVWRHRDTARFWESNAGAGPRGTPTLSNGRVYTLGATGILNALDARNGAVVWSRNAASDTGRRAPGLGLLGFAVGVRRPRHRRDRRQARRLRRRQRQAALGRPVRRRRLQLATARDDRRRPADPAAERSRRDQRRRRRTASSSGSTQWQSATASCSRLVIGGRRRADQQRLRMPGRHAACAASQSRTDPADGKSKSAGPRAG